MRNPQQVIRLTTNAILVQAPDGSGRLLDLDGDCYALDPIATTLLRITAQAGYTAAVEQVATAYHTSESRVRADFDQLLEELDVPVLLGTRDVAMGAGWAQFMIRRILQSPFPNVRIWLLLALAKVCYRILGWSRTTEIWRCALRPFPRRGPSRAHRQAAAATDAAVRRIATHSLLGHGCKERATTCWAMLRSAGLDAHLLQQFTTPTLSGVLLGELHYTKDLIASLTDAGTAGTNDAALALSCYAQRGAAGLSRLEGSFALLVWDRPAHRLFAVRDPLGGYPLYSSTATPGVLAVATAIPLLRNAPAARRPPLDVGFLAEYLVITGSVNERATVRTAFAGIDRVLPGTLLEADLTWPRVVRRQILWDWTRALQPSTASSYAEAATDYADILRAAVEERARGRVVCHVSGGLDSTSIAHLARHAADRGRCSLSTISLTYRQLPSLTGETPYVTAACASLPGITTDPIPADELLDFDAFWTPPPHDEPYPGLWRLGMDRALTDKAADAGATVILTGIGADEVLDVQPFHLSRDIRHLRWVRAWRQACAWAAADNCNPWEIVQPFGIAPLLRSGWLSSLHSRLPAMSRGMTEQDAHLVPPWVRPEFARRYSLHERAVAEDRARFALHPSPSVAFALCSVRSRAGDPGSWALATPRGLRVAHPFLDPRVVCAGMGVLLRLPPDPAQSKPLLRTAMRGYLPEIISHRRRKGHFNEVYYRGLLHHRNRLIDMVRRAPIDELEMLDKNALIETLQRGAVGGFSVPTMHKINLALTLIRWLALAPP